MWVFILSVFRRCKDFCASNGSMSFFFLFLFSFYDYEYSNIQSSETRVCMNGTA